MSAVIPHALDSAALDFKVRVLLVDDQLIIVEAVRRMLAAHTDIDYHHVTDARAALAVAQSLQPTVILQDLVMPGVDGFELIQAYRADPDLRDVPVIVLTTKDEPKLKAHGFAIGANDYLVKLPDQVELVARIRYHSGGYIKGLKCCAAQEALQECQAELVRVKAELATLRGAQR
jgi:two-component system chemotaxis family response regulator WspR